MKRQTVGVNWRWAVVAAEVVVALACVYAGWRLVARHPSGPIQVQHGAPATSAADPFSAVPTAPTPAPVGGAGMRSSPASDLLGRLNREDLDMYRRQWQVLQLLVEGTRQYIEKRVLPALLPG